MKLKNFTEEQQRALWKTSNFYSWGFKPWLKHMEEQDFEISDLVVSKEKLDDEHPKANCENCGEEIYLNPRYPHILCWQCERLATDVNGRKVVFFNESFGGGLIAYYFDENEGPIMDQLYNEQVVYVNNRKYYVYELRFGGYVYSADQIR